MKKLNVLKFLEAANNLKEEERLRPLTSIRGCFANLTQPRKMHFLKRIFCETRQWKQLRYYKTCSAVLFHTKWIVFFCIKQSSFWLNLNCCKMPKAFSFHLFCAEMQYFINKKTKVRFLKFFYFCINCKF